MSCPIATFYPLDARCVAWDNRHPDHDSICTFRTANEPAFVAAFTDVLQLARQMRLTQVGSVSVDGSKIAANASKHAAVSYQRAGAMIAQLELEVQFLITLAKAADAQETKTPGLDLPAELQRRESRVTALQQARQVIEERARELAAAEQPEYEAKVAARAAQRAVGKKPRTKEPVPPSPVPDPKAQYNFTDPESRIMKAGNGPHFEQAYNVQAAVDQAILIVGASVAAISPVVKADVKNILADSGFYSAAAVTAVEQKPRRHPQRNDGVCRRGERVAPPDGGRFAAATGTARPRPRCEPQRTHDPPAEDERGENALPAPQTNGRAGVWDHQRSAGLPPLPVYAGGRKCRWNGRWCV